MTASMEKCTICPRACGADRTRGTGACGAGDLPEVARVALHHWEEPCISGTRGSGTVFMGHCNMACAFCQNHAISQVHGDIGRKTTVEGLAQAFMGLQGQGAHNINIVTGTHYTPQLAEALAMARGMGLAVPVVWNSNGYESVETLGLLEGLVDIYLPDLKYSEDTLAVRYSGAPGYWGIARKAILGMHRQVGPVRFDSDGIAVKGLIVRHLVLPGHLDNTRDALDWIRTVLPRGVYTSVMAQYFPTHRAWGFPEISRGLTPEEYGDICDYLDVIGLVDGWVQGLEAADAGYVPPFDRTGEITEAE